jgi:hypothetical protein
MAKKLNKSIEWMTLRARHAAMGRTVLQLLANPESTKSDIQAAAEMYSEATKILESEYETLSKTIKGTYLPVLTHRARAPRKTRVNV